MTDTEEKKDIQTSQAKEKVENTSEPEVKITEKNKKNKIVSKMKEEMFFAMRGMSGPMMPPYADKINEKHIEKILSISDKESSNDFEAFKLTKKYSMIYTIIFCGLFIFLTVYLLDKNPSLYKDILKYLIIFAGGCGAGYGFKSYRDRK